VIYSETETSSAGGGHRSVADGIEGSKWGLNPGDEPIDPQKAWFILRPTGAVKFGWGAVGSWNVEGNNGVVVRLPKEKALQNKPFKRHFVFNKHFSIATDEQGRQYHRIP